jgi:hypothetical protein
MLLRAAPVALVAYGVLGLVIAATLLVVGTSTFGQIAQLQSTLESERAQLVGSVRTVSATVRDTATSSSQFQRSIDGARTSADTASRLANDTAGTFRDLASGLNIQVFGLQPLAGVTPQFTRGADQLQQLAISLGTTRDALTENRNDVQRISTDLTQLQAQLDRMADTLSEPGLFGLPAQALLPFQFAFYGMCLLVVLQSVFSLIGGIALYRVSNQVLMPVRTPEALPSAQDGQPVLAARRRV